MIGVTADTNIYISALNFPGGKPHQLLQLARDGKIDLTVSAEILDEVADVLARKFRFSATEIAEAQTWIKSIARVVQPSVQLDVVRDDPDDNRVVECAVTAGSHYIVTGDKDLLRMGAYDLVRIVTLGEFLGVALAERKRTER